MTSVGIEAMATRITTRYERASSVGGHFYVDEVAVWTQHGNWKMPYEAFLLLFGIELVQEERTTIRLHNSSEGNKS